jgi:hypothetical protein
MECSNMLAFDAGVADLSNRMGHFVQCAGDDKRQQTAGNPVPVATVDVSQNGNPRCFGFILPVLFARDRATLKLLEECARRKPGGVLIREAFGAGKSHDRATWRWLWAQSRHNRSPPHVP